MNRGEIWWAALPEPVASAPGYKRPILIIQSNEFNKSKINTLVAAVITSNIHLASAPGNVTLSTKNSKLPKESIINVSQIITIDKSFLTEKVHTLSNVIMTQVDDGLRLILKL
ncbi:MAG TPA: mRNA interferase MazF2 [Desulfobulbaceae bacterium]|nr:MAG: mRNA interferase MazF2 [Deltaproteobacteria bacterium RIFOXYD12_FULL_53_23]HCC53820.1 mRNA interferase MazF2 [Desulfobulbaceae bacterium]